MRIWNVFISVALALAAVAPGQTPASVPRPGMPTLFVIGDSTANLPTRQGWGDPFADYFDPGKITVLNRARGGRSARTFFDEGLRKRVLEELKPGDHVLIQFGHNDGGIQPTGRADLPGTGDETKQSTIPDGKTSWFTPSVGTFAGSFKTPRPRAPIRSCCRSRCVMPGVMEKWSAA